MKIGNRPVRGLPECDLSLLGRPYLQFDPKKPPPPGWVSCLLCSLIKNRKEEDPPWRTTPKIDRGFLFTVFPDQEPGGTRSRTGGRGPPPRFIVLVFGLLCRHTVSNPITSEMHTSGVLLVFGLLCRHTASNPNTEMHAARAEQFVIIIRAKKYSAVLCGSGSYQ